MPAIAQSTKLLFIEIHSKFGTSLFKREDIDTKLSMGPLLNTGMLKKQGDKLYLTIEGERYVNRLKLWIKI